tara:strand:- start:57 stop:854 length:798 start_codon:yes stop_codon:yes gene_type:complete
MEIGIIGFGYVGQALYASINDDMKKTGNEIYIYDKFRKNYNDDDSLNNVYKSKVLFLCLPSPSLPNDQGRQDFSAYGEVITELLKIKYKGLVVIKGTVQHHFIEPYADEFRMVYNPEFLSQNTSVNDFKNQEYTILGGDTYNTKYLESIYNKYFDLNNPVYEHCTLKEAADIKYTHNIYHAYKVLFWNFVENHIGNSRKMAAMYEKIVPNRNELSRICSDGKPGYGGACFPKDVEAFHYRFANHLTRFMIDYNKNLRGDERTSNM